MPDTLGRMLWRENLASITARYPDTLENLDAVPGVIGEAWETETYTYGPGVKVVNLDPLGLIGAMRGYGYQSCEHQGWWFSAAKGFCDELDARTIRKLIERTGANAWTIDSLDEVRGDVMGEPRPGGWTLEVRPPYSTGAVSISSMIAEEKRKR